MNLKNIWFLMIFAMLSVVPLKIAASFITLSFVESVWFMIVFGIILAAVMVVAFCSETHIRNMDICKNPFLGILSILISASFFWCISSYFNDTSKYDFEWQPLLMSIFSILCCIAFVLFAITFFTGKNIIGKAPFFLFCPVLWFSLSMILFLSIYNNHADVYDVVLTGFFMLFFVYYTQIFATSSESNIIKLLFAFGIPAVLLSCVKSLPVITRFLQGENVGLATASTCTMEILMAIYILVTLAEAYAQPHREKPPEVRSISIR